MFGLELGLNREVGLSKIRDEGCGTEMVVLCCLGFVNDGQYYLCVALILFIFCPDSH